MKKLLFVLLMVLSLVISLPAQAAETPIASFDFDTKPEDGWTSYTGTGAIAEKAGNPQWVAEHDGHTGVMSFDGASSLQLFADAAHTPLLKDYTTLTISFDYFHPANHDGSCVGDVFYAASDANTRSGYNYLRFKLNSSSQIIAYRPGEDQWNGSQDWNSTVSNYNANAGQWHHIEIVHSIDSFSMQVGSQSQKNDKKQYVLPTILGSDPVLFLGTGMANDSSNFIGYIDNFTITGSTEPLPEPEPDPDPNPNPNPDPEPVGPSFALNPFNNLGDYRPSLYNGITLDNGSSVERAIIAIPEDNTIILPSDATRESFTIGDKTYAIKGNAQNPRKLIGWYNIATGEYHPVTNGPATVTLDPEKNNVFYGDWIAASYDFLGGNTTGLITTADTSDFIDINVFDYSDLVNVNSMTVDQNGGLYSEKWSVEDKRKNGWLAFSDWGTYHNGGSIGFPNNRNDFTPNGYNKQDAYQGLLYIPGTEIRDSNNNIIGGTLNTTLLSTMFNQNSKPGAAGYVPGINYLGKGNYLFSYNPATGMYSYDCASNAAVYQQSEGRFYVYDTAIIYYSDGEQPDFFPLNKKTDSLSKENGVPNYWFGMDFTMDFWLPDNSGSGSNQITNADGNNSPMIFEFEGDDDMWVFIDDKLVLDIGGIHDEVTGTINFSTGEVIVANKSSKEIKSSFKFTAGNHTMKIYYLERGGDKSNCTIKFNLLPEYEVEDPGIDTVQVSKDWVGTPDSEVPPTITVELYDANKGKDSAAIKTATFGIDEAGKWAHSFSNLPHTDKNGNVIKYAIREVGLPQTSVDGKPYFDVDIATKVTTYSNAWVFTDMAGLAGEKNVVIGNGKGQVLGSDLKAHDVAKMDVANNIITQLASNRDAATLLWTIEPATSYHGGKHFYLKSADGKYLCIKLPTTEEPGTDPYLHLHDTAAQASIFYLNASGDLQDATTGHRLVAKQGGFAVETNVGGNVTTESANKASLYVMRTRETTAYTFKITNTYVDPSVPMGTLQISKTIGGNAADADDKFTFLITLKDANGSLVAGTFDKYEFVNGQCEVTLTGDESISITLPEGAHYTVTETGANGYELITPAGNKYEGTIKLNQTAKCPFHNEKNLYSLTVSKSVSGNAADTTKEFAFTVTLTDKGGAPMVGTFGNYTFDANGQCIIPIAHSESFTIPDLPDGTKYTVSEENGEYTITAPVLTDGAYAGEIKAANASVEFVNALSRFYTLTVSKTVTGNAADTSKEFAFTVTLTDANGAPMVGKFGDYAFDEKGQCVISIAHGKSFTIPDLPDGTKYTVSEDSDGYIQTAPADKEVTGTITTGENKVDFVNERNVVRLVKVTDPDSLTVAPNVTVTGDDGSTATVALTANDDASYLEIAVKPGVTYTVAETGTDIPGYAFVGSQLTAKDAEVAVSGMTFTVGKSGMTTIPVLTLTNTYAQGGLTVSKTVKGNATSADDEFTFTVTLTNADGKAVSGTFDTHTFVGGKYTFTLKGNESENFADLPIGVTYTVTEAPALGYVQTAPTEPATGVISTVPAVVSFTNERWAVDIQKKVVGLTGTDTVAPKVTVGDVVIDALPSDGKTFERIFVTPGKAYTVAEENAEVPGYTLVSAVLTGEGSGLTVNGMGFTLSADSTEIPVLTLTNTYAQGGLTVSKTVKGNATSADDEFTFTVTLTDADGKPVSGTFDTHTFVDGKCSFTLKGNESENFADLPIGVTYTVTETPALGYVQTAPTEPATGVISTVPAVVSFTNERWAVDIQKKAVGLTGTDTVAPKVTVGDVVIDALPADGVSVERIFVTPGKAYTVAEENAEVAGYTLVSAVLTREGSGLTIKDMGFTLDNTSTSIPVLTLTNTYAQGGLTVKKTIGGNAADENDTFTFTVTLTDKDGKAVSGTFDTHTFVDGKYTFTLKGNESENFADLPIGVTYTVTETPALGYVQTAPTEPATGVISTEPAVVSFTNVRDVVRLVKVTDPTSLTVAPKVTVTGSDGSVVTAEALTANNAAKYLEIPVKPGVTYTVAETGTDIPGYAFVGSQLTAKDAEVAISGMTFAVGKSGLTTIPVLTLSNAYTLDSVTVTIRKVSTGLAEGIAYPAPKVSIYAANSTAPVWTGTLTPNGSALPVKLLPGTYTVKEVIDEVEGYGFTSVLYVNGAASADKTFTLAVNAVNTELRLENFYAAEFSTLTLTKTVKGESGSKASFSFRITLTDDKGQPITERFPYTGTMDGAAPLTGVITSGSTVALRDGGSITVQLPLGVHYEVEEQEQEGYVLVSSEGEKGVIEKGGAKAAFVNKPQYTVTVTKVWEGDTADVRPASVQVQLMLNGKPVGNPVTLNAANGWKHTYTGLDAKGPYTIDELTLAVGYVSTVEEGEGNTFVITNSYIVLPPTGDAAHPALYLLALLGSAALLMLLRKRKAA